MMKTNMLTGLACAAFLWPLATGCGEESTLAGGAKGSIAPDITLHAEPITAANTDASRASADRPVTTNDLSLRLTALDGDYTNTWTPMSTFDPTHEFSVGRYHIEAFYGSPDEEGYGKPYYYADDEIKVVTGRTTPVSLSATLANSIIKVVYTDAFREYMAAGYSARIHSAGGAYIDYDETNPEELYVRSGEVSLDLSVTKPNGVSGTFEAATFTAKPRYRHTVTVDVNGGDTGKAEGLVITFDETLGSETIEIDLSDDILSASAPTITPQGFTDGETIDVVETVPPGRDLKMNVVARGKIGAVTLTTSSAALLAAGWPAEVDLSAPAADLKEKLQALGLNTLGIWNRPDEMGVIDFTGVPAHIAYADGADNTSTFTVVVKDMQGKVCDPLSLSIAVEKLRLELTEGAITANGRVDLTLDYNGADINDLTFKALNTRNTYTTLNVETAVRDAATGLWAVTLTHPASDPVISVENPLKITASSGHVSDEITVKAPAMIIDEASLNPFAKKAFIPVKFTDEAAASQSDAVTIQTSTDGSTWTNAPATPQAASSRAIVKTVSYEVTGLQPSTTYHVRAILGDEQSLSATFTTEAALPIPSNGGMERWYNEKVYAKTTYVGSWGAGMDEILRWFANSEGESYWATRNALTTAQTSGTTCYYTSYSGTIPVSGLSGQAAEISTLGYGEGSTYNSKSGGGTNKHTAVGMLFIGNHTASGETSETIEYGKPFTSRPSGFKFQYKFAPYNGESFQAYMVVENRDNGVVTELGRGEIVSGEAQGSFTEGTVNLTYTNISLKATHMYIVFLSSTAGSSAAVRGVTGSYPTTKGFSDSRRVGSVLTVDDIELFY